MIHGRKYEVPEHPVIADMERYGVYPYRRWPQREKREEGE